MKSKPRTTPRRMAAVRLANLKKLFPIARGEMKSRQINMPTPSWEKRKKNVEEIIIQREILYPSPAASRHPLPSGEGLIFWNTLLPTGEGGPKGRMRGHHQLIRSQNFTRRIRNSAAFSVSCPVDQHEELPQRFMFLFQYTNFLVVASGKGPPAAVHSNRHFRLR